MSTATNQAYVNGPAESVARGQAATSVVFWALIASYAAARVLQVYPGRIPMLAVVALHVFPPAIFALIHGAKLHRWRGILTFVGLTLVVGNFFEILGVHTGFPYGHYYFTDLMGPKLSGVPMMLGLGYGRTMRSSRSLSDS